LYDFFNLRRCELSGTSAPLGLRKIHYNAKGDYQNEEFDVHKQIPPDLA
jgi:hypothetical protein